MPSQLYLHENLADISRYSNFNQSVNPTKIEFTLYCSPCPNDSYLCENLNKASFEENKSRRREFTHPLNTKKNSDSYLLCKRHFPSFTFPIKSKNHSDLCIYNNINHSYKDVTKKQDFSICFKIEHLAMDKLNELAKNIQKNLESEGENANKEIYKIIKVSAAILPDLVKTHEFIPVGISCSKGEGPSILSYKKFSKDDLLHNPNIRVLTPGDTTTADLVFRHLFPDVKNISTCNSNEMEQKIKNGEADIGVFIHEVQWRLKGQDAWTLVADLAEEWQQTEKRPLPLALYAISKNLPSSLKEQVVSCLQTSLEMKRLSQKGLSKESINRAQEKDPIIVNKHAKEYTDPSTTTLNKTIKESIKIFFKKKDVDFKLCKFIKNKKRTLFCVYPIQFKDPDQTRFA